MKGERLLNVFGQIDDKFITGISLFGDVNDNILRVYDINEFDKFLSAEADERYKILWETLYYCGLRRGELRGLTWNDIDFGNSYLRVNKNVVATQGDENKPYMVTTPKTKSSIREIPIPKV